MQTLFFLDDNELATLGAKAVLEKTFQVNVFRDIVSLKQAITQKRPDVLLLDINLSEGDYAGIDLAKELVSKFPRLCIVFFTSYKEQDIWIKKALPTGAKGFLFKISDGLGESLIPAIQSAMVEQNYVMNKPVFDNILNNLPEVLTDVDNNPLETIEKQILIAMGNGSSQNYIAKEVIKTPSSNNDRQNQQAFDNRLNTIRAKLGLVVGGDKSRYVIKSLKMGYLRLSDFDVE